jgi:hypothetical protein
VRPGTSNTQPGSVQQTGYRTIVADPHVAQQRLQSYDYAELRARGTRKLLPCPAGGELHLPEGGVIPVPTWSWICEEPDGQLTVRDAEEIADFWDFEAGSDELREAYEQTVRQVENARKRIEAREQPDIRVEEAEVRPHPDSYQAAETRQAERTQEQIQAEYAAQAQKAHEQLSKLVSIAQKRTAGSRL